MTNIVTRTLKLDPAKADSKRRSVPAVLSTTHLVERPEFGEVLLHGSENVDLSRAPLPLIEQHQGNRLNIGIVENIRTQGNKLRGDVVFGHSQRAQELWPDVEAGIVRSLSVAYLISEFRMDGQILYATRWTPFEVSLVSIPADPNAGLYRSFPMEQRTEDQGHDAGHQSRSQRRAANQSTRPDESIANAARLREIADITAIAGSESYRKYGLGDLATQAIQEGLSLDQFRELAMRKMETRPIPTNTGFMPEKRNYSLVRALGSLIDPRGVDSGYEREVSAELARSLGIKPRGILMPMGQLAQRALTVAGAPAIVGEEHRPDQFIELLRNRSFVMNLGPRVLSGLVQDVSIPRLTGSATSGWIAGDGSDALTPSDQAFDAVTLSPKTVGAMTIVSRKMLLQGLPDAEQLVRDDLAKVIAVELDRAAINGSGASQQPTGIVNTAGVSVDEYPLAGPGFADVLAMEAALMADNADMGSLAYLTTPALAATFKGKETVTGSGQFVWTAGARPGEGRMNGLPAYATANVPLDHIVLGNWSDLLVGMWGALDIELDPYHDFARGTVAIRAFASVDFKVRHPESFAVWTRSAT